jgi:transposase
MVGMRQPIFVRPLSDAEREALEDGLRSSDAFVLRRCQILLASSRGENAYRIARSLGCDSQTARTAIRRFNEGGIREALYKRSSRPKKIRAAFVDGERAVRLREMLHRSPREFGKDTSLWTLALAAEVSFEEGITKERVSAETVRATLERMGIRWLRAKRWITSPDPQYERKKGAATG